MNNELLNKWVEQAKELGLGPDAVSSMKKEWESVSSQLEADFAEALHANIVSQMLPIDDPNELAMDQQQRMADAIELGLDLSQIEALNAAERSNRG